jgi:hypothetical protein
MNTMNSITDEAAYKLIRDTLFPLSERDRIRDTAVFNDFTAIWNEHVFNSSERVGSLMSSINSLPPQATRQDWARKFFKDNLSPAGIVSQAEELAAVGNIDFTTALNYWWCHLQDSVYNGWHYEMQLFPFIEEYAISKGYAARGATDYEDRCYGVDVIIYDPNDNNRIIAGIQIKGIKYFKSTRPNVVKAREEIDPRKFLKFTAVTGVQVWFALIEETLRNNKIAWLKAACYYN